MEGHGQRPVPEADRRRKEGWDRRVGDVQASRRSRRRTMIDARREVAASTRDYELSGRVFVGKD
eukprot:243982-Rhodomonas_salina.1